MINKSLKKGNMNSNKLKKIKNIDFNSRPDKIALKYIGTVGFMRRFN